jgi:hypothetical protein
MRKISLVLLLMISITFCNGSEPLYRDTQAGCKKRYKCTQATEDCFVGSMVFREITTMCADWKKKKDANQETDFFEDMFCDPARIAISCATASSDCEAYCEDKHSL